MSTSFEDRVFEEFKLHFPGLAAQTVEYHMSGPFTLMTIDDNGYRVVYNQLDKSFRRLIREVDADGRTILDDDQYCREFGDRLYQLMHTNGMTQQDLSDATGISRVSIINYISGRTSPSAYNVYLLVRALRCSFDDLMNQE